MLVASINPAIAKIRTNSITIATWNCYDPSCLPVVVGSSLLMYSPAVANLGSQIIKSVAVTTQPSNVHGYSSNAPQVSHCSESSATAAGPRHLEDKAKNFFHFFNSVFHITTHECTAGLAILMTCMCVLSLQSSVELLNQILRHCLMCSTSSERSLLFRHVLNIFLLVYFGFLILVYDA
jgi:hypothetical protein